MKTMGKLLLQFYFNFRINYLNSTLTMTLYVALFFTATKRRNRIQSLVLLRIHMSQERKFLRLVHWIKIRIWSKLRPLQTPQAPRVPLVHWLLHPRAFWILLFPPLKKKKRALLSSGEFWKRLAVPIDKNFWPWKQLKPIQTDRSLLRMDPRTLRILLRLLPMEPKFPSLQNGNKATNRSKASNGSKATNGTKLTTNPTKKTKSKYFYWYCCRRWIHNENDVTHSCYASIYNAHYTIALKGSKATAMNGTKSSKNGKRSKSKSTTAISTFVSNGRSIWIRISSNHSSNAPIKKHTVDSHFQSHLNSKFIST